MIVKYRDKSSGAEQVLYWRPERFLRVRGFLDALFHKTGIVARGDQKRLAGAFYEQVARELLAVQASAMVRLEQEAGPKAARLRALRAQAASPVSEPARSTAAARAARASAAEARKARDQQFQIEGEIRTMAELTEKELSKVYAEANAAVARYSKAARFGILLQSEIPAFTLTFDPEAIWEQLCGMEQKEVSL